MYHTVHCDKQERRHRNSRSCRTQCKTTKINSVGTWNIYTFTCVRFGFVRLKPNSRRYERL